MRKTILGVFVGFLLAMAAENKPGSAVYLPSAVVQAAVQRSEGGAGNDQQLRVVDVGKLNVGVGVVHRSAQGAQGAVAHEDLTEVYQILEGSGTLETGGDLANPDGAPLSRDTNGPSGPSQRGSILRGGESRHVGPGDIVILPPGTGHRFTAVDGSITYTVVRVDPDRVLPLK